MTLLVYWFVPSAIAELGQTTEWEAKQQVDDGNDWQELQV